MTLHILNKTRAARELNQQLSNAIEAGDQVLLIENGVLQCLDSKAHSSHWSQRAATIHVLEDDALARGIKIPEDYQSVDYNGFVRLTTEHTKILSWY